MVFVSVICCVYSTVRTDGSAIYISSIQINNDVNLTIISVMIGQTALT